MKRNSLRTTCRVRRHGSDPSRCLPPEDGFSSRILPGCTIERIKRELPNQDRPSASAGQRHAVRRKAFRVPERPSLQAADDVEGAVVFEARTIGVMHRSRESEPDSCVPMITVYGARCARPEAFAPKRVVRLPRRGATTHRSEAMRRMCRITSSRSRHRDAHRPGMGGEVHQGDGRGAEAVAAGGSTRGRRTHIGCKTEDAPWPNFGRAQHIGRPTHVSEKGPRRGVSEENWRAWRDSNPRPTASEAATLSG